MDLGCFTWILQLLRLICNLVYSHENVIVGELPDDIIVDIVSRLPAEHILQCRRVCRHWKLLTSSQHFLKLHLGRATPILFVHTGNNHHGGKFEAEFFIFDKSTCTSKTLRRLRFRPGPVMTRDLRLVASLDGLLLFLDSSYGGIGKCYIFNLLTQEQIAIMLPGFSALRGFFFHPLTSQFKIFYLAEEGGCSRYMIYSVGQRIWSNVILPPSFTYKLPRRKDAVVVNGALHWVVDFYYENELDICRCEKSILVFQMDSEDFCVHPHPGSKCLARRSHENMQLAVKEDNLVFCNIVCHYKTIDVWILENYRNWVWVRGWKLNFDGPVRGPWKRCLSFDDPFLGPWKRCLSDEISCICLTRVLTIHNDEIWLKCLSRGLCIYHLHHNTIREVELALYYSLVGCFCYKSSAPTRTHLWLDRFLISFIAAFLSYGGAYSLI